MGCLDQGGGRRASKFPTGVPGVARIAADRTKPLAEASSATLPSRWVEMRQFVLLITSWTGWTRYEPQHEASCSPWWWVRWPRSSFILQNNPVVACTGATSSTRLQRGGNAPAHFTNCRALTTSACRTWECHAALQIFKVRNRFGCPNRAAAWAWPVSPALRLSSPRCDE